MPAPPLVEEICPDTIGEDRFVLTLSSATPTPKAFGVVEILVDYAQAAPEGVVLPLELLVQAPSSSGFVRRYYRRTAPSSVTFVPKEGGPHLVVLREVGHNRWVGKLRVSVAGDPIDVVRPA